MSLKVGDNVRFLNSVGGGRVVRIVDGIAYVDEDGFETPVLVKECVVVGAPATKSAAPKIKIVEPEPVASPTKLPVVETRGGDKLKIVLGFEPTNIKALSQSSFEAFVVNDSNYFVYMAIATKDDDENQWTLRYDGVIEPNIQEFAFELMQPELTKFNRLAVQYVAFKRDKSFDLQTPGQFEQKIDNTKFAKLHCFRPNEYFDGPVIAFDLMGKAEEKQPEKAVSRVVEPPMPRKDVKKPKIRKPERPDVIVVDLHASELLDTTAGLSTADILNYQIDKFSEVMNANLRYVGQKIVFIHGKGEGVLRQALMKELTHRYKGHDVQDASFREYGFGATQVTIKNINRHK